VKEKENLTKILTLCLSTFCQPIDKWYEALIPLIQQQQQHQEIDDAVCCGGGKMLSTAFFTIATTQQHQQQQQQPILLFHAFIISQSLTDNFHFLVFSM